MTIGWEKLWRENKEIARHWQELPPHPEVVEMADRLARTGRKRILDIGFGMGRHLLYLAARGFEVTGIDHSPTAVDTCAELLEQAGLQARISEGEMTHLPFDAQSFDGIVASQVIHHCRVDTLQRIIDRICELLAPGGYFVWVTPMPDHSEWGKGEEVEPGTWVNPDHHEGPVPHHYCTAEEVRELLRAFDIQAFEKNKFERDGCHYSHWRILAQKPAGQRYDVPREGESKTRMQA